MEDSLNATAVDTASPGFSTAPRFSRWAGAAALLTASDQGLKLWVAAALPLHARIEVAPVFSLVHTLNPGAAFSFLADAGGWQRHVLTVLGIAVTGVLLGFLWRGVQSRWEAVAYTCIVGGALGNVCDRLRLGAVVDFLDFHWRGMHWPAFNLADVYIVAGAGLLVVASFRDRPRADA